MPIYPTRLLNPLLLNMLLTSPVWAQEGAGIPPEAPSPLPMLIIFFLIFYFFLIRPQQKQMKNHRQMVENLQKGDTILTGGGIKGTVAKLPQDNDMLEVEIAKGLIVEVRRATISEVLESKHQPANNNTPEKKGTKVKSAAKPAAAKGSSKTTGKGATKGTSKGKEATAAKKGKSSPTTKDTK